MRTRPDAISQLRIGDRLISVDEHGFLVDPEDWTEEFAAAVATEQGLKLTEEHWAVLRFMREFLATNGVAPDARFAFRFLEELRNDAAKTGRERFFEIFPYGYVSQACKISGMRQPRAWSTG